MRKRLARLGGVLACLVAVLMAAGMPTSAFDAVSSNGIRDAGLLERIPADVRKALGPGVVPDGYDTDGSGGDIRLTVNGSIILMPEVRQLWHVYQNKTGPGRYVGGVAAVRNLDSMKLVRSVKLETDQMLDRASQNVRGAEWAHAIDPGKRLFLYARNSVGGLENNDDEILEIDVATFQVKRYPLLGEFAVAPGSRLVGLQYDTVERQLIGMYSNNTTSNTTTYIVRVNPQTQERALRQLAVCDGQVRQSGFGSEANLRILTSNPHHIFVPCQRSGYVSLVVRLARRDAFTPGSPEDVTVGPVNMGTALADQRSGRMFLITTVGEAWVYDSATSSFIGVISSYGETKEGVNIGYGLDPETGRFFFQSASFGFGIAEGRFFPIPQALTRPDRLVPGQEMIWSDARTGRIFVLEGTDFRRAYRIYKTDPAPAPPKPANPDANTINLPEKPGVTEASFAAGASGYGMRVLFARGVSTIAPAPSVGVNSPTALLLRDNLNSRCGFDDRELFAARVRQTDYENGSAVGKAIELDLDPRTQVHIEQPSRCHVEGRNGSNAVGTNTLMDLFGVSPDNENPKNEPDQARYAREAATCSSGPGFVSESPANPDKPGTTRSRSRGQTKDLSLGTSEVRCPVEPGGPLAATSTTSLAGAIDVDRAQSFTEVKRLEGGGVTSTVTSYARGINIAGVIQIGEIWARATSTSNGLPRTADGSTYEWRISGLVVAGQQICNVNKECDPNQALAALNRAGAGRVQFRIAGGGDEALRKGTPRGALTAVQKSEERQVSDQALVGDFTTELPTLEMVVYNDNQYWGRARQLYQFAGVSTTASYNISRVPTGSGLVDLPDLPHDVVPGAGPAPEAVPGPASGSGGTGPVPEAIGPTSGGNRGPLAAITRGLRLLLTNPRQAILLMTAWAMFGLPLLLAHRRRLLAEVEA